MKTGRKSAMRQILAVLSLVLFAGAIIFWDKPQVAFLALTVAYLAAQWTREI
jgi:hypothetical protein